MKMFLFVIFFLISFCKFSFADEQQIIAMGDIEFGEYLGAECEACHHQAGISKGKRITTPAGNNLKQATISGPPV